MLPLRFGAVMTTTEAVVDELLTPHHDEFLAALNELEGRAEYVVKGRYVEQRGARGGARGEPEAARLREEIRHSRKTRPRDARIRLGEIVNQAIEAKREADTAGAGRGPGRAAPHRRASPPTSRTPCTWRYSIETDRQDELEQVVDEFADRWAGRVTMRLLGPLAPTTSS